MEVPRLRPHQQPLAQPDRRDHTVREEVPRRDGGEQRRAELLQEDGLPACGQARHNHPSRSRLVFKVKVINSQLVGISSLFYRLKVFKKRYSTHTVDLFCFMHNCFG